MFQPIEEFVNPSHTVERIQVPLAGNGDNATSVRALETLRRDVIPSTLGTLGDANYAVTGQTAGTHDFNQTMKARFPLVFVFVLGLAFLLLLVTFRSIVVPITAIVLNLLSVAASYGVLVWIFQDGHLQGLFGFHSNGAVVTWLPLFLFTVLFGLSMDYHVFIVSRIKELVDRGEPNADAVAHGIRRTASTVTSAAAVMVAVFAIFASLRTLDIKQLGVGLAVAVLLDATVIRGVLLPGDDEAARRLELVPAAVARLAAPASRRRRPARRPRPGSRRPRSNRAWQAGGGTRTHDARFTGPVLCQLSYSGVAPNRRRDRGCPNGTRPSRCVCNGGNVEHPKTVGDRSVLAIIGGLQRLGYGIYMPFGENTRCDLIVEADGRLVRVQCKTGRLRRGAIEFTSVQHLWPPPQPADVCAELSRAGGLLRGLLSRDGGAFTSSR